MDNHLPPELKEKMTIFFHETFKELATDRVKNYGELLPLWQEFHNFYITTTAKELEKWARQYNEPILEELDSPDKIQSNSVVIELTDDDTGKIFRRILPIEYIETDNGIRLSGETPDGTPTQIAFFSDTALTKINDLLGLGPDAPRCQHDT